jgi:rRNA maturation RNase YbeY
VESSINFFSEDIDFSLENESLISDWIQKSIIQEKKQPGEISFIFSSDENVLKINNDYLDHDFYTDIITFDYRENDTINGDIFISIDRVKENALSLSLPFQDELHRVIIHGVLHIIGYKDKSSEEESLMRSKEDFYLSLRTF